LWISSTAETRGYLVDLVNGRDKGLKGRDKGLKPLAPHDKLRP
jgi:hypothetical protein